MQWFSDHALQLTFMGGYLILMAYLGWVGKRRAHSLGDYLVGGRRFGGVVIALSYYATFVSSVTFVGHAGRSYSRGPMWWVLCVVIFGGLATVAWVWVAPPFVERARRWDSLTIPDFLGSRYNSLAIRRLAGIVVVVASLFYMVAVYVGAVRVLESLLGLDQTTIVVAVFVVVTAYTLAGGFYTIVTTDAIQGVLLLSVAAVLPVAMMVSKGGLMPLLDSVREANPSALSWSGPMPLFTMIGLALGVGLKFVVEPRQLSRFYGLASSEQLRRGRWLAPGLLFFTYLCMLPVGFLAHAFASPDTFHDAAGKVQADRVVPFLLGESGVLGPVLGSFFLTGLIAAAMSSLDSVLLVAASSVDHDIIAPHRDRKAAMRHTRMWVLVLSAVAAIMSLVLDRGVVEMSSFSGSIYGGCFLPALVVGLYWNRATKAGALSSLIVGLSATVIWFFIKQDVYANLHEVYVGLAVSMTTYVLVSLATKKPPADGGDT